MKQNERAIRNMDDKTVNNSHINSKKEACEIIHFIRRWRFYLFKKGVCGERKKVNSTCFQKANTHREGGDNTKQSRHDSSKAKNKARLGEQRFKEEKEERQKEKPNANK